MEEQIKEHETAIIKLKRARNSLLNVSKLPPEILGDIFCWDATLKTDFGRSEERSHNFLLVCHHWFEVASCTPELWSFWGDNLRDWTKRHLQHPTAPLDLVLNGSPHDAGALDECLRKSLQDRAARDTIRRIHLVAFGSEILDSIISPLTGCKEIRSSSVESVIIRRWGGLASVDVSDFFAYYLFPKLQRLKLESCTISSWDFITSNTCDLTTLDLAIIDPSPKITSPQILSMLRSSPSLRKIALYACSVPDDGGGKTSPVPLAHLKELTLSGRLRDVFALLRQLNYPISMNSLVLHFQELTINDISETIGPFLRDHFRHRQKSQSGLGLYVSSEDVIEFRVRDVGGTDFSAPELLLMAILVRVTIYLNPMPPADVLEGALLDLIAHIPREEVVYFHTYNSPMSTESMSTQLPYLRAICFEETPLGAAFPESTLDRDQIFPHLQRVTLKEISIELSNGWAPLIAFLDHLESSGNKLDILELERFFDIRGGGEEKERIRRAVREFRVKYGGGH